MTSTLGGNLWDQASRVLWQPSSGGRLALHERVAHGAVWSFAGAVIAQGLNLLASIVTARLLGRTSFGQVGVVQSTVGMFSTLAGLALGMTATKFVAENRSADPARAGRILGLSWVVGGISSAILSIALFFASSVLAGSTLKEPAIAPLLRIAAVLVFLNGVNGIQIGALTGFEAFKAITHINSTRAFLSLPATIVAVRYGGTSGALWAMVIAATAACFLSQRELRLECRRSGIRVTLGEFEWRILWEFSIPSCLGGLLVMPVSWAANTILVRQPHGYAEMGIFSAATQWRAAVAFLPGVLGQIALPLLSNLHGENEHRNYRSVLKWILLINASVSIAVAAPLVVFARSIMRWYGPGYEGGALVLALAAVVAILTSVNTALASLIISSGSMWVAFALNALWAAALLISSLILIPRYLATGLSIAYVLAYVAHTVSQSLYGLRRLRVGGTGE